MLPPAGPVDAVPGRFGRRSSLSGPRTARDPGRARHGGVRERPNRHDWKSCVGKLTVGSNPTASATWARPHAVDPPVVHQRPTNAWNATAADLVVTIPMADGVDSLNVATAAAVAFHALVGR